MSFLSVLDSGLKKILPVLKTAAKLEIQALPLEGEIVSFFNPAAGALISMIGAKVIDAEAQFTAAKAGAQKKQYVLAGMNDALTLAYALQGKPVPPDATAGLSSAVDSFVALMNAVQQTTTPKG
jgi:hypothetical protein